MNESNEAPKYKKVIEGLDQLSLGISIVVAVLIGFGIGYGLKMLFHREWLVWLGLFWGVAAAINNIYKAYKKQKNELDKLADDPRYTMMNGRHDDSH